MNQQIRYDTALSYLEQPVNIRPSTGYPTIYQQASDIGGTFTRIKYGLPDQTVANFSPCLTAHKGHRLIAWRNQPEPFTFRHDSKYFYYNNNNSSSNNNNINNNKPEPFTFRHDSKYFYYNNTPTEVYIGELIGDDTIIGAKKLREKPHRLSYEDPRLFVTPDDNLYAQFITSSYASIYDSSKHTMVNLVTV